MIWAADSGRASTADAKRQCRDVEDPRDVLLRELPRPSVDGRPKNPSSSLFRTLSESARNWTGLSHKPDHVIGVDGLTKERVEPCV
jgi:hypothetical protein